MPDWNPKLFLAAARTFEGFCFANPIKDPDGVCRFGGSSLGAAVDFTGPFGGSVSVRMSEATAIALTQNILGDDVGPEAHLDTLKELANVVCGNALPEIAGTTAAFRIGPPYLLQQKEQLKRPTTAHVALTLPEGCIEVAFAADVPAPAPLVGSPA